MPFPCQCLSQLISNSDVENVVLGKLRSRVMVQIQRDEKELDYEHIDPTDPEVLISFVSLHARSCSDRS